MLFVCTCIIYVCLISLLHPPLTQHRQGVDAASVSKPQPVAVVKTPQVIPKAADPALESTFMSPYVAQEEYKAGKNPDIVGKDPCFLQNNANGKLLDNIHIEKPVPTRPGNRLFCGTYTFEKNHATNVRIMKQTWTKKCDGWLAFSTVDDASIPCEY